ncbi:MAG: hypothetical protein K2M91_07710, partial [Lachnospiraceae bacterium]|nr:hypothetical protein [Lachnospiraceae bacterium]
MDYENLYQNEKQSLLEQAVLTKSPEEISALYKQPGQIESSARALGLACRFRGLEYVKALVEGGASFAFEHEVYFTTTHYWLAPLEINTALHMASVLNNRDVCFSNKITEGEATFNVLPMEQRTEIVAYLYQNREKVCLDAEEMLYYSIMSGSKQITKVLKEFGVKFSQQRIEGMTENGWSFEWQEFCSMSSCLDDEEFFKTVGGIVKEIDGKKLHYTEMFYWANNNRRTRFRLYEPDFFRFLLEHFNQKKMNKTRLMKGVIDQNSVACLEICAENGWLAMPRKRDEMIEYASKNGKAECSAWLLEFKNRTADFA